ncbi:MAG: amidohydrolase [Acidobacteria bacterium]|nr:amidohydrolase [Acidobacteriota bacterium]MCA1627325.1 amidohydrolase [Acidobacteriota bacterium]
MRKLTLVLAALLCLSLNLNAQQSSLNAMQLSLDAMIERDLASLLSTYKALHAAPELSHREEKTSAFVAGELRKLGFTVTDRIGKFQNAQWTGYGVVGVLKNGPGPTVLVRTELDALPVEEKTGVPYSSNVKAKNDAGVEVSVMHACGHDIHMTSFLGTAKLLTELKGRWSGTLVMLAQPAEETGDGANAMLRDDLYTRFPKPDFAIALHDKPELETGKVGYTPGYAMAGATSIDIKIRGIGGHGSAPETTKDPVVMAAQVVMALQTIISRENSPLDPAVVTVGSIHGGTRYNIIPDEVNLQLTVRTYKPEVRQRILASIERIVKGVALTAGIPEDRAPVVKVSEGTGSTYNDPQLLERLAVAFKKALGEDNVVKVPPIMASEDFGYFSLDQKIPTTIFWLGASDPAKVKQSRESGVALPGLHSALFAPVPEPTLRTGVKAMTSAVLELMKK